MSQIKKLIQKFTNQPTTITYRELEKILLHVGFEKIQAKGSHVKFKHRNLRHDIIIPVHSGECKDFYKTQAKKQVSCILKAYEN